MSQKISYSFLLCQSELKGVTKSISWEKKVYMYAHTHMYILTWNIDTQIYIQKNPGSKNKASYILFIEGSSGTFHTWKSMRK